MDDQSWFNCEYGKFLLRKEVLLDRPPKDHLYCCSEPNIVGAHWNTETEKKGGMVAVLHDHTLEELLKVNQEELDALAKDELKKWCPCVSYKRK